MLFDLCGGSSNVRCGILGYRVDTQDPATEIEACLNRERKLTAVIVCNPSNPNGMTLGPEALRRLIHLTSKQGALLIADECYPTFPIWRSFREVKATDAVLQAFLSAARGECRAPVA